MNLKFSGRDGDHIVMSFTNSQAIKEYLHVIQFQVGHKS